MMYPVWKILSFFFNEMEQDQQSCPIWYYISGVIVLDGGHFENILMSFSPLKNILKSIPMIGIDWQIKVKNTIFWA